MTLAIETNTSQEYYKNLGLWEIEEEIRTFNQVNEKKKQQTQRQS